MEVHNLESNLLKAHETGYGEDGQGQHQYKDQYKHQQQLKLSFCN